MYSLHVSLILFAMVFTGAARAVAVKIFYQMGFEKPFFVNILFHLSGLPAFAVYLICSRHKQGTVHDGRIGQSISDNQDERHDLESNDGEHQHPSSASSMVNVESKTNLSLNVMHQQQLPSSASANDVADGMQQPIRSKNLLTMGSQTGLTQESHRAAAALVNCFPSYFYLIFIGVLDFVAYLLSWSSFLWLDASVTEMLLNGLQLIFTAVAARTIRKRQISNFRWFGVFIVTSGLVVIGVSHVIGEKKMGDSGNSVTIHEQAVGISLCIGAGIMGAALLVFEELLVQEGGYSPLIVLSNEGLWGLLFGLILYYPLSPVLFDEDPKETWQTLAESTVKTIMAVVLVIIFTFTGIASLYATAVTSSMTRNIWQHLRAIPVWAMGLLFYYGITSTENHSFPTSNGRPLGEPFLLPYSLIVLGGFLVMTIGIYTYYLEPSKQIRPEEEQ